MSNNVTDRERFEVLVVDDIAGTAETFAELIAARTQLSVAAASNPDDALRMANENPILVAVLDQKMVPKSGTELYRELIAVDGNIAAIMLTGEAGVDEAGEAHRLGYADILSKHEVDRLPDTVKRVYFERLATVRTDQARPVELVNAKRSFGRCVRPAVSLLKWSVIDTSYVRAEDWKSYLQIHAGQNITQVVELTATTTFELTTESRNALVQSLGTKMFGSLEARLQEELHSSVITRASWAGSISTRREVAYHLPQPDSPDQVHIRTRNFQYAPIYRRVRAFLQVHCGVCGVTSNHVATVLLATGNFATRHEEFLSDDSHTVHDTGMVF